MRARLLTLALGLALGAALFGHASQGALPMPSTGSGDNVVGYDTWHGSLLARDYHSCDAVAQVTFSGVYDLQYEPDGSLVVALGLTDPKQRVELAIDGTRRLCP